MVIRSAGPIIVEGNYETDSLNAEVAVGDVTSECNIVSIEKAEVDPLAFPNEEIEDIVSKLYIQSMQTIFHKH